MTDSNKISFSDLVDEAGILAGLKAMLAKMQAEIKAQAEAMAASLKINPLSTGADLKKGNADLEKANQLQISNNELAKQKIILEQKQIALDIEKQKNINSVASAEQKRINELNKATIALEKQTAKENALKQALTQEITSLEKLRQQTNAMVTQRDRMIVTTEKDAQARKHLTAQILENTNKLKAFDTEIGRSQRNVGNYKSALDGIGSQFTTIFSGAALAGLAVQGMTAIWGGIKEFVAGSTKAFSESEKSAKQLEFTVINVAGGTAAMAEQFKAQAKELSLLNKASIFTDEQIQSAQKLGLEMGMSAAEVRKLIPLLVDVASAKGLGLEETMNKITLGMNGTTKGLKSLGVFMKDTGDKTSNLTEITKQLTKYQGGAANALNTTSGQLQMQENAMEEAQEVTGKYTAKLQILWNSLKVEAAEAAGEAIAALDGMIDMMQNGEKASADSGQAIVDWMARVSYGLVDFRREMKEARMTGSEWADIFANKLTADVGSIEYYEQLQGMINETYTLMSRELDANKLKKYQDAYVRLNELYREKFTLTQDFNDEDKKTVAITKEKIATYSDLQKQINNYKLIVAALGKDEEKLKTIYEAEITFLESKKTLTDQLTGKSITQAEYTDLMRIAQEKLNQSYADYNTLLADVVKKELVNAETSTKLSDKMWQDGQDAIVIAEEKAQAENDLAQAIKETTESIIESYIKRSEAKQESIDKEMEASKKYEDTLRELAKTQVEGAAENLAYEQRAQAELDKKKQQEIKKQKRLELGLAAVTAYGNMEKKGDSDQAFTKTVTEITKLMAFIGTIPEFKEGVIEFNGKGTTKSDSNLIKISDKESILKAEATAKYKPQLKDMNELKYNPLDYVNIPRFANYNEKNTEKELIKSVQQLTKVVENKTEYSIDIDSLTHEIIERVKTGNTTIINKYKRPFLK